MRKLSLFAGIGGIDLAAEWAGIKTIAFCEREPFCQKVLAKHWPDTPIFDDVTNLTKQNLIDAGVIDANGTIELISAGYPCQPYSHAGERKGEEDDRHLWPEVSRLLQEIRPTWFLGENVDGHVSMGLDDVLSDLAGIGYTAEPFVIPACAVGATHRRDRVFIVAHTSSFRQQGSREPINSCYQTEDSERQASEPIHVCFRQERPVKPGMGRALDGISSRLDGLRWPAAMGQQQYEWEPPRVIDGMKGKVREARLKALGNAVVPAQVLPILAAIRAVHDS